jgi:hypothetical protein
MQRKKFKELYPAFGIKDGSFRVIKGYKAFGCLRLLGLMPLGSGLKGSFCFRSTGACGVRAFGEKGHFSFVHLGHKGNWCVLLVQKGRLECVLLVQKCKSESRAFGPQGHVAVQCLWSKGHLECRKRNQIIATSALDIKAAEDGLYIAEVGGRLLVKLGSRMDMGAFEVKEGDGWKLCSMERTSLFGRGPLRR